MNHYQVSIQSADGATRIPLLDTDMQASATSLVTALVGLSGQSSFGVLVSIVYTAPPVSPPPPAKAEHPADPTGRQERINARSSH